MVKRLPLLLDGGAFDFVLILGGPCPWIPPLAASMSADARNGCAHAGTNDLGSLKRTQIVENLVALHRTAHARGCRTLAISLPEHFVEAQPQYAYIAEKRKETNEALR